MHQLVPRVPQTVRVAETANTEEPPRRASKRPRQRWIVPGVVVLVALGLGLAYSQWWTRPTAFNVLGNGLETRQTTHNLHPVTFDMVERSIDEAISLHDISARVVTNTADASISFAVCQRDGRTFMAANGTASRSCRSVTNAEARRVHLTPDGATTITMTVTPHVAGRVVIAGMDVDYRRGANHLWQHGLETTGPTVQVRISN
jgi:hypothetical protein